MIGLLLWPLYPEIGQQAYDEWMVGAVASAAYPEKTAVMQNIAVSILELEGLRLCDLAICFISWIRCPVGHEE